MQNKKMLTQNDYELKIEDSFDMHGNKWFPHQLFKEIAAGMDGEILFHKRKILKPKMTDLGLVVYVCLKGEFQLYLVQNLVYEIFNDILEVPGMILHIDGDKTNNHINNLELA